VRNIALSNEVDNLKAVVKEKGEEVDDLKATIEVRIKKMERHFEKVIKVEEEEQDRHMSSIMVDCKRVYVGKKSPKLPPLPLLVSM